MEQNEINLVDGTPSSSYESYTSIVADIETWTNSDTDGQLGTKTVLLKVPEGHTAKISGSFEVDDWGYIKITREEYTKSPNDETPITFLLADYKESEERKGPMGGHSRWGGAIPEYTLPAGFYSIEINQTNIKLPENKANNNISVCKLTLNIEYVEERLRKFSVVLGRSSDAVEYTQEDVEKGEMFPSGYVYTGELIGHFGKNDSDGNFVETRRKSYGTIQTGGWMDKTSAWFKGKVRASENGDGKTRIKITADSFKINPDPHAWPDTCCPDTVTAVHTFQSGGKIAGFEIDEATPDSSNPADATDPTKLREALEIHKATRIGSEGCLTFRDENGWQELRNDMMAINGKNSPVPKLSVSFSDHPDYYRHPKDAEVTLN